MCKIKGKIHCCSLMFTHDSHLVPKDYITVSWGGMINEMNGLMDYMSIIDI